MALEIFKLVGSIFVDNEKANESIAKTDEKAEGLGNKLLKGVGTAAKWGAGIATAAAGVATAVTGAAMSAAGTADEVDKMSQKIGLSKQGFQEWSYIMGQNGMDIDKMQTGMKTLVAAMDSANGGTASAIEKFDQLGLSIYDSSGKLKDQETMMQEALYALADMENGTEKARLATELFGKSGVEMMPMLNQGSQAITDLKDRAHELGLIMSDETVNAGVKLGDTMDDVKQSFGMIGTQIGASVMPIVQQFLEMILQYLPTVQGLFSQIAPVISGLMSAIMPPLMQLISQIMPIIFDTINAILPVLTQLFQTVLPVIVQLLQLILPPLLQLIQAVLPVVTALLQALMPIFQVLIDLLTPIIDLFMSLLAPIIDIITQAITPLIEIVGTLIASAMEPLIAVIKVVGDIFGNVLNGVFQTVKSVFGNVIGVFEGIITFLKGVFTGNFKMAFQGIVDIVKNIFGGIIAIVKAPINGIIGLLNGFIDGLNKIQIPDWVPGLGGKGLNIGHIPTLFNGGNVGSGTLISANEKEPEIVGNYGKRTLVVNNAQIIDTMVSAISQTMEKYIQQLTSVIGNTGGQLGDIIIPVYLGEEMLDEIIVKSKERVTKRSGGRANA